MTHIYYYAKAVVAALGAGVLYLTTVIGPDITFADLGHVSLLHWIGFAGSVLGVGGLTAVVSNGPDPAAPATAPAPSIRAQAFDQIIAPTVTPEITPVYTESNPTN